MQRSWRILTLGLALAALSACGDRQKSAPPPALGSEGINTVAKAHLASDTTPPSTGGGAASAGTTGGAGSTAGTTDSVPRPGGGGHARTSDTAASAGGGAGTSDTALRPPSPGGKLRGAVVRKLVKPPID